MHLCLFLKNAYKIIKLLLSKGTEDLCIMLNVRGTVGGQTKGGSLHFSISLIFLYILKFLTMDICLYHMNSESVDDGVGYQK